MAHWVLDTELEFISPKNQLEKKIRACGKDWIIYFTDLPVYRHFDYKTAIQICLCDKNIAIEENFRIEVLNGVFYDKGTFSKWSAYSQEISSCKTYVKFNIFRLEGIPHKIRFYIKGDNQPAVTSEAKPQSDTITEIKSEQKPEATKYEEKNEAAIYKSNFPIDFCINLNQLHLEGHFTDILIRCDTEIFKAHRVILSARSPVFATMLQNPMKESKTQEVDIKDMKPEVLRSVLTHIYTNKGIQESDSMDMVFDMLAGADKYMLIELKHSCVERLKSIVSVDNSLKILSIADLYDMNLKEYIIQFVCKEYDILKNTTDWKTLKTQNPSLIIDVFTAKVEFTKEK